MWRRVPNRRVPTTAATPKPPTSTAAAPKTPATTVAPAHSGTDPRYPTCKAAKAAGYGPYTSDQAEYGWYRDADHDGIVCE